MTSVNTFREGCLGVRTRRSVASRRTITWIVVRSDAWVSIFSPAEAKRLGHVLERLADEAFVANVP
jgi:hypothetical protein